MSSTREAENEVYCALSRLDMDRLKLSETKIEGTARTARSTPMKIGVTIDYPENNKILWKKSELF